MSKEIILGYEGRKALKRGIDKAANAIKPTLGAIGKTMMIDNGSFQPIQSDDGVTGLKNLTLKDPVENMGVLLMREIASKTDDGAGDGTTTGTTLGQKIIHEAFKEIGRDSSKVERIKRDIIASGEEVIALLNLVKEDVSEDDIERIATISALDQEVGKLIADTFKEVGIEGTVKVEASNKIGLSSEIVKGMKIDSGFVSPHMVTNQESNEAVLDNPVIWLADRKISSNSHIAGILQKCIEAGKTNILIIAEDIDREALATMVVNKLNGTFNVVAIKAPNFGMRRRELLEDIATLTGSELITEQKGMKLEDTEITHLGTCEKVIISKDETVILGGQGDVTDRVAKIKKEIAEETVEIDKDVLKSRIASLTGGIGVIKVGAFTEAEINARKYKIEDAINATRAAIEEGVVAGGGVTLAKIATQIKPGIVSRSLTAPFIQMAINAGMSNKWYNNEIKKALKVVQSSDGNTGVDFKNMRYVDMIYEGILDPVKVTRFAVSNAISMATTVLTTETLIVNKPDGKE